MIIKKSIMKANNKSSYSRLAKYIMSEQTQGKIRNIAMWNSDGYDNEDTDLFLKDVKAVQDLNTLSKDDKTYHLIISFRENEIEYDKLKDIEYDITNALGFGTHQRLCVVHNDTDNLHMHIAINKIDKNGKIYTPYRDYQKLNDIAAAIELKYDLKQDNHIKSDKPYSKAKDIEKAAYLKSFNSYIDEINLENISSWYDFHKLLNKNGIKYLKKGAGAVFVNDEHKIYIKASSVNRSLSLQQLENKLGSYEYYDYDKNIIVNKYDRKAINDNEYIYNDYITFCQKRKKDITNQLEKLDEDYKEKLNTELYNIKKLMNMTLLSNASYIEKLIINKVFHNLMQDRKKNIYTNKLNDKNKIYEQNPYMNFVEWLKKEAINNNSKAINYINKQAAKENYIIADMQHNVSNAVKVTKNGTYITEDNIRFKIDKINISNISEYNILKNLEYYEKIYPNTPLKIQGTSEFHDKIINVIASNNLKLRFDNAIDNKILDLEIKKHRQYDSDILTEFNKLHNDKMYKFKQLDYKENEYEYRGFFKYDNSYFICLKSYVSNTFYLKVPNKKDFTKVKLLKKGSSIMFEKESIDENLILNQLLKHKEVERIQYKQLDENNIDINKLTFTGVRKYKNEIIYLYENKNNNRIYTKIATQKDKMKFKKEQKNIEKILSDKISKNKERGM